MTCIQLAIRGPPHKQKHPPVHDQGRAAHRKSIENKTITHSLPSKLFRPNSQQNIHSSDLFHSHTALNSM